MRSALRLLVVALIVGGTIGYFLPDLRPNSTEGQVHFRICATSTRVNCVVDGDTIWYGGKKIRIEDIDTPEISKPKCDYEEALGQRAKQRLLELLNAGALQAAFAATGPTVVEAIVDPTHK